MSRRFARCLSGVLAVCIIVSFRAPLAVSAEEEPPPFYPDGRYDPSVPAPESVLGFRVGERPVGYGEAVAYFTALADASPRVLYRESGRSWEGRAMYYLVVTSEENMARLDAIRADRAKLADPRTIDDDEAARIVERIPANVWLMYTIHGNEFSGTDSSVQLAYQLAAGTDAATEKILRELVIGLYPMQNPDGRERFLAQMKQWNGMVPGSDSQSIQFGGVWPGGRTNHYLFDLNRDWFILAHPESRARVETLLDWNPQVVIDAHEMSAFSTYLFNPPRDPINLHIHPKIRKWWRVFAKDQAGAFDRHGWSYFTREWLEDWYPGYTTSWTGCIGAVPILYEQAYTGGTQVKRPDGTVLTFRDAVHHHFVSSLANLTTAAENRAALLEDFHAMKKEALAGARNDRRKAFLIPPGGNPSRARSLVERLLMQGIEIERARSPFTMKGLRDYWDDTPVERTLPAGTWIIPLDQPKRPLVNAILEFDPRLSMDFLREEREDLEKGRGTRMYEISTWSMLLAYGVEACVSDERPDVDAVRLDRPDTVDGTVINPRPAFGFVIDYADDSAVQALIRLFENGCRVRASRKPFTVEGRSFPRGSLLVRLNENDETAASVVDGIARETGAEIVGVNTALSDDGPDLGGGEFQLLMSPRVAVLAGPSISTYSFGELWYLLDTELRCRYSLLNSRALGSTDLRKYNVLILPSASPSACRSFLGSHLPKLRDWVEGGGTLIALGGASAFFADSTTAVSRVRLYRDSLGELERFEDAVKHEETAWKAEIDSLLVWEYAKALEKRKKEKEKEGDKAEKPAPKPDRAQMEELDRRRRLYYPRGTILRAELDVEHWMNFGMGEKVPALIYSTYAYLSKKPVETPARFAGASDLRVSGLLWPEARTRWAKTAYATRESLGKGQVILFAGQPTYRSYFYGTGRMLVNSILLGPGFGTQPAVEW